jgi:hypothetical protein
MTPPVPTLTTSLADVPVTQVSSDKSVAGGELIPLPGLPRSRSAAGRPLSVGIVRQLRAAAKAQKGRAAFSICPAPRAACAARRRAPGGRAESAPASLPAVSSVRRATLFALSPLIESKV